MFEAKHDQLQTEGFFKRLRKDTLKRYNDFNTYLKGIFKERVQKISLDAGLSCPNRDGTISRSGCIFCNQYGSGTAAFIKEGLSIEEQIFRARKFLSKRYKAKKFIAYFQSFSNTYAPVSKLKSLYDQALVYKDIVGLAIATRPDCINDEILNLISSYKQKHLVWIELGLQSAHDTTLKLINRGHDVACFEKSVLMADRYGLNVCVHIILGLPGENREMMLQTISFLSRLPFQGIKIHLMYVEKDTQLAKLYETGKLNCLKQDEYVNLVVDCIERLPPNVIIQRLTGDPRKSALIAPNWAIDKALTLKLIHQALHRRNTWQGKIYRKSSVAGFR